jgi:flavin reductase (DIM6/NTAB) family NADH-FMN oxidoreductase RutF
MSGALATLKVLARPLPLWTPIALTGVEALVEVRCETDTERDVTHDQVIVSLAPLLIAIGDTRHAKPRLRFLDRTTGFELGCLDLRVASELHAGGRAHGIYEVTGGWHHCLATPLRQWNRLLQMRGGMSGHGPLMTRRAIEQMSIFYLSPRPVVLVSVDDGVGSNLFPMDLIGTIGGAFSLALRSTSPSVATLRNSHRAALGDVAPEDRDLAYSLGRHHRETRIDWATQPFATVRSALFGLPLPASAVRIRECEIENSIVIGSHTVFACRIVHEEQRSDGPQLHHTSGIHQHYRERTRRSPWSRPGEPACT